MNNDPNDTSIDLKQRHKLLSGNPQEGVPIILRQSIRINTLKGTAEEIVQRLQKRGILIEKIPFLRHGYWADADFSLASTEEHLLGLFYIQEAAAQLAAEWLNPLPGELVLDCCASPGGKTTQLAQLMKNKGTIIALDVGRKVAALQNNLERLSVKNAIIYNQDARFFSLPTQRQADKILVDAPFSGNYAIEKEWYKKRTLADVRACSRIQREIVLAAIRNLKKGGTLVYCTCSLELEEDEEMIAWVCKEFPVNVLRTRKVWPGKERMQGMFVAEMQAS